MSQERKRRYYADSLDRGYCLGNADRLRQLALLFQRLSLRRMLDVGCGDGDQTLLIKEVTRAQEVFGLDLSREAVELCRAKGVQAFQIDLDQEDFPFPDGFFDAVFCLETIEHLFDPDHLLVEIYRTLKRDGIAILSCPNLSWWLNCILLPLGFQPGGLEVSLSWSGFGTSTKEGDISGRGTYQSLHLS